MRKLVNGIVVVALLLGGAFLGREFGTDGGATTLAKPVSTALAQAVKADDRVIADAKVVPVRSAALSLPQGGRVSEVLVAEGDQVKPDQLLVRLDHARQAAAVAEAEAGLHRAQAELDTLKSGARPQEIDAAQAALDGAQAQAEIAKNQFGSRSKQVAVAQADVRRAAAQLDLIRAGTRAETLAGAEASVAAAQAALDQAKASLAETELRAPFGGTVGGVDVKVGEGGTPGAPAVRLADLSAWQIETDNLTELSVVRVRGRDKVEITFDAIPDLKLPGQVTRIQTIGEDKHGDMTYTVTVKPDRQDERLRWNMSASVAITPN